MGNQTPREWLMSHQDSSQDKPFCNISDKNKNLDNGHQWKNTIICFSPDQLWRAKGQTLFVMIIVVNLTPFLFFRYWTILHPFCSRPDLNKDIFQNLKMQLTMIEIHEQNWDSEVQKFYVIFFRLHEFSFWNVADHPDNHLPGHNCSDSNTTVSII